MISFECRSLTGRAGFLVAMPIEYDDTPPPTAIPTYPTDRRIARACACGGEEAIERVSLAGLVTICLRCGANLAVSAAGQIE